MVARYSKPIMEDYLLGVLGTSDVFVRAMKQKQ